MEKRSKTNKEIFEQKYPFKELAQNPLKCAEDTYNFIVKDFKEE